MHTLHRTFWAKICNAMLAFALMITFLMPAQAFAQSSVEARRSELEAELREIEREIEEKEAELAQQKQQTGSLVGELDALRDDINARKREITVKTNLISNLTRDIDSKKDRIDDLNTELGREKAALGGLIRASRELEDRNLLEFFASGETLSEWFYDFDSFRFIKADLYDSSRHIETLQEKISRETAELESRKDREADVRYTLEQDKKKVEEKEDEQAELVSISKNKEKSYEQVIAERRQEAAKIRVALFKLKGVEGGALQFGEAYELAKRAGSATGIRPAFILAILKQETNLGSNIGTCNRPQDARKWNDIMPGPNDNSWRDDQTIFLALTTALGVDSNTVPLSCPAPWGGWGGAMGISQFIPATWATYGGLVEQGGKWVYNAGRDRIRNTLGSGVMSSPWNNLHGITATALYMKDLGATAQTYTAEREAACKYYSGRSCSDPKVKNAFYGNSVMNHAADIQRQVDILESVN